MLFENFVNLCVNFVNPMNFVIFLCVNFIHYLIFVKFMNFVFFYFTFFVNFNFFVIFVNFINIVIFVNFMNFVFFVIFTNFNYSFNFTFFPIWFSVFNFMWELETITGDDHLDWNTISHFFWGGAINSYHWNVMMIFVCNFKPFFWYFRPYSNLYYKHRAKGIYNCKVCNTSLFLSSTKYDSGSGWPSFFDVIDKAKVAFKADASGSK